jgi:putative ABC transport system substrate-binding protein
MFTLLGAKNLELLHEFLPKVAVVGAFANPNNPNAEPQVRALQAAARVLGIQLIVLNAGSEREIGSIFATLPQRRIGALVVTADGFLISRQDQLVALAARYAVPTMYPLRQYVAGGGLISYGANLSEAFRHARQLRRKNSQGREARRSSCRAADAVRVGDQPPNRKDARADDPTVVARAGQ